MIFMGVIFTILVPIMFPVAGKAVSDIGMAKSKMAAMIAEQVVQLQLKIMEKKKKLYFVWYNIESGRQQVLVPTITIWYLIHFSMRHMFILTRS